MGKLVTFEKRPEKRTPKLSLGKAEIVIFTGVRYERGAPEPGKPPASDGPKRKRG